MSRLSVEQNEALICGVDALYRDHGCLDSLSSTEQQIELCYARIGNPDFSEWFFGQDFFQNILRDAIRSVCQSYSGFLKHGIHRRDIFDCLVKLESVYSEV